MAVTLVARDAATAWAADNRLIRSHGTTREVQASGITVDDSDNVTGIKIDANGSGTALTNIEVEDFAASAIVTEAEGISSNDNDTTLPTSAAVKDYVDDNFQPLDSDLTTIAGLSPSNDDIIQRKAGAWTNRTMAQLITDLAALGTTFQPLDSDLTSIAALSTAAYGRSLLTLASAEAGRTSLVVGLPPGFVSVRVSQAADTDHDITFAVGKCRNDTDTFDLVLGSALTKQIDAAWTVGTNQGGIDTGSVGNNTIYYLWVIARSDTGVVDALFSTSATSPTMPANYDRKQRVGWVRTDGSANILAFRQATNDLDEFRFVTPITDVATTTLAEGARTSYALSVPPTSEALIRATIEELTGFANVNLLIMPLTETDQAPNMSAGRVTLTDYGTGYYSHVRDAGEFRVETNASSQIAARMDSVGDIAADIGFYVSTKGAKFRRGILP